MSTSSIFSKRTYEVYKAALNSNFITQLLVRFYNVAIKNQYYVERWLNILDTIVDKEKGPVLGKLRIIQLIEADLQLMLSIFFSLWNDSNIEEDLRLLKCNFGMRKGYSVKNAILEKQLLFESNSCIQKQFVYTFSNMEACYHRKDANIIFMVEESVGVHRDQAMLFSKLLPWLNYYLATSYGISKSHYGGVEDPLCGTEQGNILSGTGYRNQSYFIFKYIEKDDIGVKLTCLFTSEIVSSTLLGFVNNVDLLANRDSAGKNMQTSTTKYIKLYETTLAKISEPKIFHYS